MEAAAATKLVYEFTEGSRDMRELLGGKGANVAEMTRVLGPDRVPAGFTITTEACVAYMERDGFPALLAMRLLPVVPFWLLNLGSSLAGIRLPPFVLATTLGIVPAAFVYVSAGAGLGGALASGVPPGPGLLLRPEVLLPPHFGAGPERQQCQSSA